MCISAAKEATNLTQICSFGMKSRKGSILTNLSALNKCTYFAVIDKLQKAKSVDPSVAEEANKLISTYAAHTPKDADLFFLSLKKGDSVTIGGWIGETTTIR